MLRFLAHGGEVHETAVESASHSLLSEWYFAVPVFLVCLYGLVRVAYLASGRSQPVTAGVALLALFVIGIGTYQVSAAVSVLALSAGFGLALFTTMIGLSGPKHRRQK